jgi:hypothetical protein
MFRDAFLPRWLLVSGLCVPVALLVGFLLAGPLGTTSLLALGLILSVMTFPLLLRWHHVILIMAWNAAILFPFLPGQPYIWTVVAVCSLFLSVLRRTLDRNFEMLRVPSLSRPLILLGIWVLVTAFLTGGFGGRALGQELWGGKKYLGVLGAVIGFLALAAHRIPEEKARLYASLFFLSGLTLSLSDLVYMGGPKLYSLYAFLPAEYAMTQALSTESLWRLSGVGFAAQSFCWFLLARFGIRGLVDLSRPWRLFAFVAGVVLALLGGFRSTIILLAILLVVQFFLEGMFRTRFTLVLLGCFTLCAVLAGAFVDKLPLPVQRSISFLPIPGIDPSARVDAQGTLNWRLDIWKTVFPEVPQYLLVGKGFAYNGTDYYLTSEAVRRGVYRTVDEATLISGSYHQGILTIIIPFAIWGLILFVWFCWASLKLLIWNYRYGKTSLRLTNTFLLSFFICRLIFYVVFYGQFDLDLFQFTGIVGLSVALNGGFADRAESAAESAHPEPAPILIRRRV